MCVCETGREKEKWRNGWVNGVNGDTDELQYIWAQKAVAEHKISLNIQLNGVKMNNYMYSVNTIHSLLLYRTIVNAQHFNTTARHLLSFQWFIFIVF